MMLVRNVESVTYNELGEIELSSGEKRRCRVLEVDGSNALVQLFESTAGINPATARVRFTGHVMKLGVSPDMRARVFDGLGNPIDGGPSILPEKRMDINGLPMNSCGESLSAGIHSDGNFGDRWFKHAGAWAEAADFLSIGSAACAACRTDRTPGEGARHTRAVCRGVCRNRDFLCGGKRLY